MKRYNVRTAIDPIIFDRPYLASYTMTVEDEEGEFVKFNDVLEEIDKYTKSEFVKYYDMLQEIQKYRDTITMIADELSHFNINIYNSDGELMPSGYIIDAIYQVLEKHSERQRIVREQAKLYRWSARSLDGTLLGAICTNSKKELNEQVIEYLLTHEIYSVVDTKIEVKCPECNSWKPCDLRED